MNYLLFLTKKYLTRGAKTHISFISWVAMSGLCVGVMALIVVLAVMSGFDKDLKDKMLRLKYHVIIEGAQKEDIPASMIAAIERLPSVQSVASYVEGQVFVKEGRRYYPCVVTGYDFSQAKELQYLKRFMVEGSLTREGIIAGRTFAQNNNVLVGEDIPLVSLERKNYQVPLTGIFLIGMHELDAFYLLADVPFAKMIMGNNYYSSVGIRLSNIYDADAVKKKVKQILPSSFFVRTWTESNIALFSALKLEKITMFIILSLIILVACFNIFATLTVKVVDKIRDIGILHSLGISAGNIVCIFTFQGMVLAVLGIGVGIILGITVCFLIGKYHFVTLPETIYYVKYLPVDLKMSDVVIVSAVALLLAFFASLIPALRITKIQPAEALRYE